jgi:hypothetical protein
MLLGGCGGSTTPSATGNPMPSITSLSPSSVTAGSGAFTLTVNGSGFVSGSQIRWNGAALTTSYASASQLSAQIPGSDVGSAGSASVTVVSPSPGGGTSGASAFAINNPVPTLVSISPSSVSAGSGAFTLTVTGTNFVTVSVVNWNGVALPTTYASATQLTAQVPATDITNAGTATITVLNPTPGGATSGAAALTIATPGTLSVAPLIVPLTSQQTQLFTASLSGGGSLNLSWSVDGIAGGSSTVGTITASGTANAYTYTPGSAAGTHTITATNTANSSQSASATAAVTNLAGVYTYHNDVARTGQNLAEYALTTTNVSGSNFGKLWSCPVDSDIDAQPLYVAGLSIAGGKHNVVFVATMHDSVYAFDADNPSCVTYWHVNLIPSGGSTISPNAANCFDALIEYGITGTPVIDPSTGTIFLVTATTESGNYIQRLHALNITSGAERTNSPVVISLSGGNTPFSALINNQRPGLLASGGQIYIGWSSHCDVGPYSGWVASYNETTLAQTTVLDVTPNQSGGEGGVWMSGGAPAVDSTGSIFLTTGNGNFSNTGDIRMPGMPNNDFGMSVLRLNPSTLAVPDFFTPNQWSGWSGGDLDISAAGVTVIPDGSGPSGHANLLVTSDKGGRLYLIDRDNMSGYNATLNGPVQMTVVPNQSACSSAQCTFSTPAYYNGTVYMGQTQGAVVAMPLSEGIFGINAMTDTAQTSSQSTETYNYPSPTPAISASPSGNAILWVLDTNANGTSSNSSGPPWPTGPAILRAYDATDLGTTLYSSSTKSGDAAGNAIKFSVPVIANGHVYVGGSKLLTVYGLLN